MSSACSVTLLARKRFRRNSGITEILRYQVMICQQVVDSPQHQPPEGSREYVCVHIDDLYVAYDVRDTLPYFVDICNISHLQISPFL